MDVTESALFHRFFVSRLLFSGHRRLLNHLDGWLGATARHEHWKRDGHHQKQN